MHQWIPACAGMRGWAVGGRRTARGGGDLGALHDAEGSLGEPPAIQQLEDTVYLPSTPNMYRHNKISYLVAPPSSQLSVPKCGSNR